MANGVFWRKLVAAVPSLPFLAIAMLMTWIRIAYNGVAWISTPDLNGETVSTFYIISTSAFAVALIALGLAAPRVRAAVTRPAAPLVAGVATTLGCVGVIAVGPYIFGNVLSAAGVIAPAYYSSCVLAGAGLAGLFLSSGSMYGRLLPRNAIVQLSIATIVSVGVYFAAMGFPNWRIAGDGPLAVGTVSFLILPLLCGFLAWLDRFSPRGADAAHEEPSTDWHALPRSFWKLTIAVGVFSFAASMIQAYANYQVPIDVLADQSAVVLLFQVLAAFAFVALAVAYNNVRFSFGRLFSVIMVIAAFFVVLAPTAGVYADAYYQTLPFAMRVLEFVFWCLLFFTIYQRRLSGLLVLGLGYGIYMAAAAAGWLVGTYAFPAFDETPLFVFFCIALSFATLLAALILFSEKEFDRLFEQKGSDQAALSDLMARRIESSAGLETRRGKFNLAIDFIAEEHGLSKREKEVLRHLAMGHESNRIADEIGISWNTVRTHTRNLYSKLDVHTRQEVLDLVEKYRAM